MFFIRSTCSEYAICNITLYPNSKCKIKNKKENKVYYLQF